MDLLDILNVNHIAFIYFIIFIVFFLLFIKKDGSTLFFILILFSIFVIIYWKKDSQNIKNDENIDEFMNKMQNDISTEYEIPNKNTFQIHKYPKTLSYVIKKKDFVKVIYDLKFLLIYDKESYHKLIGYLNYFLKIHYNTMLGKYDFEQNFPILQDLRNEILNTMKTTTFNTPNLSTVVDIPDINLHLQKQTTIIQALTYKYLKIIYHKYVKNKQFSSYNPPFEYDPAKDNNYELF